MLRRDRVEELLGDGERIEEVVDLGTSHAWTLHRVTLRDGREVFVKAAPDQAGVFAAEAAGLRWLAGNDGADLPAPDLPAPGPPVPDLPAPDLPVPGPPAPDLPVPDLPVPEVLANDEHMLILPWLPSAAPTARAAERFGRELAAMHSAPPAPAAYGAPWAGFIAHLPLDNTLVEGEWSHWYAERRLEPFLRRAAPHLSAADVRLVERVIEEIDTLSGPPEPPARVHGDLWSGNVLWTDGRGMVIDPAAHGGHRETDLAMLGLFGAPHLDRVLAAYDEASPLADGWRERVPLHQLHPLLVHVALFGEGYRAPTTDAARAALAMAR